METGRYLSDSYLSMLDKMAADEAALRTIEKMMQNEPSVSEFRAETTGFKSWFTGKTPVSLFWKNQTGGYQTDCQLRTDRLTNTGILDCDQTHQVVNSEALRLDANSLNHD